MGKFLNINKNPSFLKFLIESKYFQKDKFKIIDVGARGGIEGYWKHLDDQIEAIGFEAQRYKLKKFQAENTQLLPIVLSDLKKVTNFYISRYKPSSSLYPPNIKFLKRFPDIKNLRVTKKIKVETMTLDSYLKNIGKEKIDFMKLDVEGAELEILKGAKKTINSGLLGLSVEVCFNQTRSKQPLFPQIDIFLRSSGFNLYDISIYKHSRNELSPYKNQPNPMHTPFGQIIWGQAIYFKDPLENFNKQWTFMKVLKLSSLFDLFNLQDCSLELITESHKKKIINNKDFQVFKSLIKKSYNKQKIKIPKRKDSLNKKISEFISPLYNLLNLNK